MADPAALPPEEKVRELTADPKLAPAEADRYGDLFAAAGKYAVAMMFYERSKNPDRLDRIKKAGLDTGDAFLLHAVAKIAPDTIRPDEWLRAGNEAMRQGKFLFAKDCYDKAGDVEKTHAAREAWLKIFPTPGAS